MRNTRVASVQIEHTPNDKQANLAKVSRFVEQGKDKGVEMIVFPECCITGYWHLRHLSRPDLTALAEPVPDGPSSQTLVSLARQYHMTVGAGLVEIADDGTLYNTYVVAMPDGRCRRHRKIHCFVSEHMASGSDLTVFDTPHGCRVAVRTGIEQDIRTVRFGGTGE